MEKIYGATERQDGVQVIGRSTFEVFYGFGEDEQGGYQYRQRLSFKPILGYLKEMIIAQVNKNTEEKITQGFKWKGHLVWLSKENQLNYERDFAVADKDSLPTYKFGTDEKPDYYTFGSLEEFKEFTAAWSKHVRETLMASWDEKQSIDWDKYKI